MRGPARVRHYVSVSASRLKATRVDVESRLGMARPLPQRDFIRRFVDERHPDAVLPIGNGTAEHGSPQGWIDRVLVLTN